MLQIKKKCILVCCKYNLQFLFRNKNLAKNYSAKKKTTQAIFLKSPKHFNIGKQKILSLAYKTPKLLVNFKSYFSLLCLTRPDTCTFKLMSRKIKINPTMFVKSVKLTIKTKFKLKWLEI